ncbi:MAG: ACP S-malonyltransferase [Planctomycetaceae bacterium]
MKNDAPPEERRPAKSINPDELAAVEELKTPDDLRRRLATAAFAFRGYNITNLGRTRELLEHPAYGPTIRSHLEDASKICASAIKHPVDLVERVAREAKSSLHTYPEDLALIVSVSLAQVQILREKFDIQFDQTPLTFGYSLGEMTALIASGVYTLEAALTPILILARDTAELGKDASMGVLFSRGGIIDLNLVNHLCVRITNEGNGTIGVSSILSPNTMLLIGQRETVDRFKQIMHDVLPKSVHLRKNPNRWPPVHTPITWQKSIPDRASVLMEKAPGGLTVPKPGILSCITGGPDYNEYNSREMIRRWIDSPQKMWDVVDQTLAAGIDTVVHVGPEPNLIPATFTRLSIDVSSQLDGKSFSSMGLRAVSRIIRRRSWLTRLLSNDAALLRAPFVQQISLENWLLDQIA